MIFSHWFGEDGEPIRLSDPLINPFYYKLLDLSENSGYLDIKYTSVSTILPILLLGYFFITQLSVYFLGRTIQEPL